jgi:putative ABC transport system permease protein
MAYFSSLNPAALLNSCPGGIAQGLIWGVMALGVYLTFRVLNMADLTVDGSFATGGAVCIMLVLGGWNPIAALLMSCVAGMIAGLVTGVLHTALGIPDILAGILTQISLYSINLNIMGKANQAVNVNKVALPFTSNAKLLVRTIGITAVVVAALISVLYWYLGTETGSALRATGTNPNMSRAQGINTDLMKVLGLALSNGLVALSGGILSQYQGFADVNMGRGSIVIGLAAVIIGEVLGEGLMHNKLNFWLRLLWVAVGSVIYYIVYVFVLWLKFPPDDMKLLTAIVVAIFLAIPYLKAKYFSRSYTVKYVTRRRKGEN